MYSNSLLEGILKNSGNEKCLECQTPNPQWASFPTAVFLCFKCARAHKKFANPQITKSLETANFTQHEISLLSLGGNFRFTSLMNEYSISLNEPSQEHKYQTIITAYYCSLLEAEVNKLEKVPGAEKACQELTSKRPTYEIGGEINVDNKVTFSSANYGINANVQEEAKEEEKKEESSGGWFSGFFGYVNNGLHKAAQFVGVDESLTNVQNKISEGLESSGINSFVKGTSEKVVNVTKGATSYIKNKGSELYQNSTIVHSTVDTVGGAVAVVGAKTKEVAGAAYDKTKEVAGAAYDKTKEVAGAAYDKTKEVAGVAFDKTKEVAGVALDKTKEVAGVALDKTKEVAGVAFDKTKEVAGVAFDKTKEVASGAYNVASNYVNNLQDNFTNRNRIADENQFIPSSGSLSDQLKSDSFK